MVPNVRRINKLRRLLPFFSAACVLFLACASILTNINASLVHATPKAATATGYNYGEALQKAIYFYDEQVSGPKPSWDPVSWVGNSGMTDGSDVGLDLTGGFNDAGDNMKFGLPMAWTITMLSWSVVQYHNAYVQDGQLSNIMNIIKWGTDYFIKAHPSPDVLYGQVGDPSTDHAFWGAPEVTQEARPSYKIDESCPGSDLAGETAAADAAASMVFQSSNPSYASTLVTQAEQLYSFADNFRGKYDSCITSASSFYTSYSGYNDELVWGALWLYQATQQTSYLTKAESYYANLSDQPQTTTKSYQWTISWDDQSYGCYILLAELTGQQQYIDDAQRFLDWWTVGVNGSKVPYSPGGEAFLSAWGSLRYSTNTAFLAFVYSDYLGASNPLYSRYHSFAVSQVNYVLGSNPRNCSYMVGFGSCYPQTPHHRRSAGSWDNSITDPSYQRHILYGAMVGGPAAADDSFTDNRQDYQTNEPADDYNAGLSGALAAMVSENGGSPVASLPDKAHDDDEIYSMASINNSGTNFTEIKALFINKTGWPARVTSNLSMRYYFTLEPGVTPSMLTLTTGYTECGSNFLSGPTQYSGNIYYVTASCAGTLIYPGGQSQFQKQVQFRIASSGAWDPTNDWSYQGVAAQNATPVKVTNIPVFDGTTLVWGALPGQTGTPTPTPTSTPVVTPTPTPTSTPVVTPTPTSTPVATPTPTSTPVVTPTPTPKPTATPVVTPTPNPTVTPVPTPTATPTPGGTCGVSYVIQNQWPTGFTGSITITNKGSSAINSWTLKFTFPGNQQVTQGWNATWAQSGEAVTVASASWNGTIGPNASVTIGFNGSLTGSNAAPTSFLLNNQACATS